MNCYELDSLSRTNVSAINYKEFVSPCVFIINIRHRKKVLITLLQNKAELRSTGIYFFEAQKPTDVSTNVRNFQDFLDCNTQTITFMRYAPLLLRFPLKQKFQELRNGNFQGKFSEKNGHFGTSDKQSIRLKILEIRASRIHSKHAYFAFSSASSPYVYHS